MNDSTVELVDKWIMPTYRRQPIVLVKGAGSKVWDSEGNEYLDFVGGIAVTAVGHAHPRVTEAISAQARELVHTSNLFYTRPMAALAEKLCTLLGWEDGRVFFANSGAEANECAIKLVRRWSKKTKPDRTVIVAAFGSFHGRTLETLAATGQPAKWEHFLPLPPGFRHVPYDDPDELEKVVRTDSNVCAVMLEPILGEGGIVVPDPQYLPRVRAICDRAGIPFIADEVQTGLGRTGRWFAFQHSDAQPDVITLAKALGNGLPIGACVARGELATAFEAGDHATTVGGGPVLCAAALAILQVIEEENLVERAAATGKTLKSELEGLVDEFSVVSEIRGEGLLLAIVLKEDLARSLVSEARARGLLVNDVLPNAIRLAPALSVGESECAQAISILREALRSLDERVH